MAHWAARPRTRTAGALAAHPLGPRCRARSRARSVSQSSTCKTVTRYPTPYTIHPAPHIHPIPLQPTQYIPHHTPQSSECGTHKRVKARFWPWLSGIRNLSSCLLFARKQLSSERASPPPVLPASERRENSSKGVMDFYLQAKARIWP